MLITEINHRKGQKIVGFIALLLTAMIWGFAFAAQRQSVVAVPPQIFLTLRSFLGGLALLPVISLLNLCGGRKSASRGKTATSSDKKVLLTGGFCCGIVLGAASLLQQWGLVYSSAGKGGFLTAHYIIMVPVIGFFFKRKTPRRLWGAVLLVLCGSFLLCTGNSDDLSISKGDVLLIACAMLYSVHILVIDHFAPKTDCIRMSCIQFFTAGLLAAAAALIAGDIWNMKAIRSILFPLLYCGICSSGIAYTLQSIGQKYVHPVMASLLMSLESVFSAIGGWLFLGERLTGKEIFGCTVIFAAIILAQVPVSRKRR